MKEKPTYQELERELEILKAKDKTKMLLDCAGVMFIEMDTDGVVQLVNKKACEIFGYTEEEMLGKGWFENFVPERIKSEILPISKKLLSGEIESTEYYENPIRTKSGEEKIIYWHNTAVKDSKGKIIGHLSSGEDITERKKSAAALKENEEKFRTVADYTYNWEYWQDEEGNFIYVSPSCKRMTGYEPQDFYKDKDLFCKLLHPDDKALFLNHKHNFDEKGNRKAIDYRIITRSNEIQWIGHVCQRVIDEKGIAQGVRGSNRLITQYKKAEERVQLLSNMVEQSPATMVITELDGSIIYVNRAFTEITGYTSEEAMGQNPRILNSGKTDPLLFVDLWNTITKGETWRGDFINKRKNGEEYYEKAILSSTLNDKGEILNYFAVKEDVTARRLARIALQESNATKDKLFSIIAHDLRSPFNAILGFSELLLENHAHFDVEKREKIIQSILDSSKKTYTLVENLLSWASAQTGRIKYHPDEYILEKMICKVVEQHNGISKQKEIKLSCNVKSGILVFVDEFMIETVLRNLVSNAIKFTHKGGNVKVSAFSDQSGTTVQVKDNGVGISKDRIQQLFHIAYSETTIGTDNEKGSGLGLLLCKDFVEKHKGKIWVESEEGKGTVFSFTIPN
ncbi:MAG: PAS domain S-box protein [Bacteroidales bacterium]|nr:PAS domain S-box protein [Bacteroidales bacterium]